jgi:tetratricopeptide (TPR) repeat protein
MFTRNTSKKKATNASPTAMLVTTTLTIDTEETTATLPPIKQATSPSKSFIEKFTNHEPISPSHESERGNLNILPRSGSTDEEHPVRSSDERSMVAKTLSIMHLMKDSKAPKTNDLISSTEEYQRDLNGALKFRLEDMKDEKENNTALSYYDLGLNYMKIAHTNDILKQEDDATRNRQSALEAFDQAISLASDNPNELALYSANKAKCLYNMYDANDENDERLHEAKTLAEKYSNAGVANETLGYIYTCYGNYEKALSYFERSLQDHEYKAAHKILSLYDQTVVLAALGRKEEALARFKRAEGKKLPIEIDTEDKILITEIRTEKYKDYIFKLAKSAHSGGRLRSISDSSTPDDESIAVLLDQQEKELRSVTVALLPGTKSQLNKADEGLTTIKQQTSAIHKKIAIDSRPYLNDQTKLQRAINKHTAFNDNDLEEIQKAIKNDSRLSNFSNEIQMFLNATYAGSQAVLSKEVAGQASNQYGLGSWIASKAGITPLYQFN